MKTTSYLLSAFLLFVLISCGEASESTESSSDSESNYEIIPEDSEPLAEDTAVNHPEDEEIEVEEETDSWEYCETEFEAYVSDGTGSNTNIRNAPSGEVVLELLNGEDEYFLSIIGCKGKWFKIKSPVGGIDVDYEIPGGEGWIHSSVMGMDTRNYGNQPIEIQIDATPRSEVVGIIEMEAHIKPVSACDDRVQILYEKENGEQITGWIFSDWICGNPLTTCP